MMRKVTYHAPTEVQIRSYEGEPISGNCTVLAALKGCGPNVTHSITVSVGSVMLSFAQMCEPCTEIVRAELLLAVE